MTATMAGDRIDMGRVISRTFGVVGRNFTSFYILGLVLYGAPQVLIQWFSLSQRINAEGATAFTPTRVLFGAVVGLIGLFLNFLMQGALTWGAIADLNGRRAPVGELVQVGLRAWLPLLGIAVLYGLALVLGLMLLVVPGLVLLTMWAVVVPAQVVERPPGLGAFARSQALTKGRRWTIFGLLIVFGLGVGVVSSLVTLVVRVLSGGTLSPAGLAAGPATPMAYVGIAVIILFNMVWVVVGAAGVASIYYELRTGREGIAPEALAEVFA